MAKLFAARKVVVVWLAAKRVATRSTSGAESGAACDHGISTKIREMVDSWIE